MAVGANFAIAITALVLSRPISRFVSPALPGTIPNGLIQAGEPVVGGGILLAVAFINGLGGLECEVLWIRYMAFLVNSTYVFPTFCFYLLGLGLGGLVYVMLERWISPARQRWA
jgi:hypothetical protein